MTGQAVFPEGAATLAEVNRPPADAAGPGGRRISPQSTPAVSGRGAYVVST